MLAHPIVSGKQLRLKAWGIESKHFEIRNSKFEIFEPYALSLIPYAMSLLTIVLSPRFSGFAPFSLWLSVWPLRPAATVPDKAQD
jgi:hypothetical protein